MASGYFLGNDIGIAQELVVKLAKFYERKAMPLIFIYDVRPHMISREVATTIERSFLNLFISKA